MIIGGREVRRSREKGRIGIGYGEGVSKPVFFRLLNTRV